jgi:hypothetical protein
MTRGFVVAALALLPLSPVVAGPKVPSAGAAAPVTVASEEAMAAEVAAALEAPPLARTALSSKAELGRIVGVAEAYLSTPIVLSLSRQRVGNTRLTVHNELGRHPVPQRRLGARLGRVHDVRGDRGSDLRGRMRGEPLGVGDDLAVASTTVFCETSRSGSRSMPRCDRAWCSRPTRPPRCSSA